MLLRRLASLAAITLLATGPRALAQLPAQLDTVHVRVAARSGESAAASTRTVEVIGADQIARRPGYDLADILSASLGLDVFRRSPAQADLAIRGSSFNQVVILVDGVRVSDLQSGHYNMDLGVPVSSIERIEILRGAGSALYGADAIGGVISIVTKRRAAMETKAGAHAGTFGSVGGDLTVSRSSTDGSLLLSGDASRSDGHRPGTDYRVVQSRLALSQRALGGVWTGDASVGVRDFGAADFYGAYPSYEDARTQTAALGYRATARGWEVNGVADTRRHSDLYTLYRDNPAVYQNRHLSWQTGGRVIASTTSGRVGTVIGLEGLDASLTSARLGDHDEQRGSAFTETTVGAGPGNVVLNLRGDWSSRTGGFLSPGVAMAAPIRDRLGFRASVNRGFRSPTWTEMYYSDPANVANPDLRSETFTMAEVGLRATPAWGRVDLAVFDRDGKDLIDWTKPRGAAAGTKWQTSNVESANFLGFEAELALADFAGLEWRARGAGLTFTSKGADTLIGKYALSPITESLGLDVTSATWLGARVTVSTLRARRAGESEYWRTDVRASRPVGGVTLRFDALNLGNASYRDASARPVAGRILMMGVELGR